jgi:hypothetical protein
MDPRTFIGCALKLIRLHRGISEDERHDSDPEITQ